jgi:hypothetical protein
MAQDDLQRRKPVEHSPGTFSSRSRPTFQATLPPEVLERRRAQLRVARRVLDRSMAEPILNASRVVAGIGQGMAQRVRVDLKGEAGCG